MKTKIELTKAAFERWFKRVGFSPTPTETLWQSLIDESEKPERIERYVIVESRSPSVNQMCFERPYHADAYLGSFGGKLIKLVEEVQP